MHCRCSHSLHFLMSSGVNQNIIQSHFLYFEKYLSMMYTLLCAFSKGNTIWMIILFPRTVGTDKHRSMAMKISLNTYSRMKMASGVKCSTWRSPLLKSIAIWESFSAISKRAIKIESSEASRNHSYTTGDLMLLTSTNNQHMVFEANDETDPLLFF